METSLRLAQMWWAGFKVFCRWCAFGIVVWMLWLPLAGLSYLVGDHVDRKLAFVLMILLVPIPFYFASKYLLLLGDRDQDKTGDEGGSGEAAGRVGGTLGTKIIISMAVALLCGYLLSPPDLISEIVIGVPTALLCGVSLLVLSRFRFMKSASRSAQTLVCALTCAAAVLLVVLLLFGPRIFGL